MPNPNAGRPKGSKNKSTLLVEAIKGDFFKIAKTQAPAVFAKLTEKALEGDVACMKIFIDKLLPNATDAQDALKRGDLGINIVISDMKSVNIEEKVIESEAPRGNE